MVQMRFIFSLYLLPFIYCKELRYALFTSGPTGGFDSSGAVPAIELAEELINADNSILPGYNLTHTPVVDTMCDRTVSLNEYFEATSLLQPTILGLLGCGCSAASEPVAEIIHHNSLSQVSYASSSTNLSGRKRFPNFFNIYPSGFSGVLVTLVRYYGWKRIAIITENENLFTDIEQSMKTALMNSDIEVASSMVSSEILSNTLNDPDTDFFFEGDDYRVFFINTHPDIARHIICEAHMRGFKHPRYAWITYGWYEDRWWAGEVNPECPHDKLADFLHRSLAVIPLLSYNSADPLRYSKLTIDEFRSLYWQRLDMSAINYTTVFLLPGVAYDALWTFAIALNRTNEMVGSLTREEILNMTQCGGTDEETGVEWEVVSLENFTYSNQLMGCIIRWNLERTDFVGVSGRVSFETTGSRARSRVLIVQYRLENKDNVTKTAVAYIEPVNDLLVYTNNQANETVFPSSEGGVPPDGTPVTVVITFHLALVVTFYALAVACITYSTVCLVFNYTHRKKRVVRLNSPNLNYLIIIGSYIMNAAVFFRLMPSTDIIVNAARCNLATLLNTIGYCLAYSAILVKLGRIHYVLNNQKTTRKILKDWHLVIIALVFTGIGTLLSVLQVSIPILQPQPYEAPNEEPPSAPMNEYGLRIKEVVLLCYDPVKTAASIWFIVTSGYFVLLQFIGLILALRLYKVNLKALENSRYIIAAIYISAILLLIIVVSVFTLQNLHNIIEVVFSGTLMVSTTVFLTMVFIPKMVSVYRDPEGEHVFVDSNNLAGNLDTTTMNTNVTAVQSEDSTKISQLETKIATLQQAIRRYQIQEDQSSSPSSGVCVESRKGSDIPLMTMSLDRKGHIKVTIDDAAVSPPKSCDVRISD